MPLSRFPERIQLRIAVNNSLAKVQLLLPQRTRPSIKGVFWKEDLHSYLSVTAPLETLSVFPYWLLPLSTSHKCRSFAPDSPFPPGGGNGNPLQYSCWGNPMDRGAWRAIALGIARVGHNLVTKQQQSVGPKFCTILLYHSPHRCLLLLNSYFNSHLLHSRGFSCSDGSSV